MKAAALLNNAQKVLFIGLIGGLLWTAPQCAQSQSRVDYVDPFGPGRKKVSIPWGGQHKGGVKTTIYTPQKIRANVIVLPGWKFSRLRWLSETNLEKLAEQNHMRLICPDMLQSIYASRYYPETRMKWGPVAGQQWIVSQMIPWLQKKKLLLATEKNFLLGLSTGGRGVALLALAKPKLFTAAAALSGDFDQSVMPYDRLMSAVYGTYQQFPERWNGYDNPQKRVHEWKTPIYLAHGRLDRTVPFSQTQKFYEALKKAHPNLILVLEAPNQGHDFKFWGGQNKSVIQFFNRFLSAPTS